MKVQKLRTETLLQKNAKHRAPEGIRQRLMNEEVKCDKRVRLNHLLKDM